MPPQKNTIFVHIYHPTPRRVQLETFTNSLTYGKNIVFLDHHTVNFGKFAVLAPPAYRNLQSCPFSPDNHAPMNVPPWAKDLFFLGNFLRCPPKNLQMSSNLSTLRVIFNKKSRFQNRQFLTIQKCPKQYFDHFDLTQLLPPILWNPCFYSPKTRWTTNEQSGGQLINSQTGVEVDN